VPSLVPQWTDDIQGHAQFPLKADKMSGTDIGHIGRRKPFSVPNTFSFLQPATARRTSWPPQSSNASQHHLRRYSPQVLKSNSRLPAGCKKPSPAPAERAN
jgi:hypothetical protein